MGTIKALQIQLSRQGRRKRNPPIALLFNIVEKPVDRNFKSENISTTRTLVCEQAQKKRLARRKMNQL